MVGGHEVGDTVQAEVQQLIDMLGQATEPEEVLDMAAAQRRSTRSPTTWTTPPAPRCLTGPTSRSPTTPTAPAVLRASLPGVGRLLEDALEDAGWRWNAPVTTQRRFPPSGGQSEYLGLYDAGKLVHSRITAGERARERMRRG
jgi:hypothetical protein